MKNYVAELRRQKLIEKHPTERIKIIYEWVKTDVIGYDEFVALLKYFWDVESEIKLSF